MYFYPLMNKDFIIITLLSDGISALVPLRRHFAEKPVV